MIIQNMRKTTKILSVILLATMMIAGVVVFSRSDENVKAVEDGDTIGQEQNEGYVAFSRKIASRAANFFHPTGSGAPSPPLMKKMKSHGCVADGLLNGYGGDTKRSIKLINRSECYYLHRAIETWLEPPDFEDIEKNMDKVKKKNIVYGMFIAEAIDTKADYYYPAEDRDFDFSRMCRPGSRNFWDEHTCKPSFNRNEYRKYLRYITEKAMDLGVQSFMFGQIYFQDTVSEPMVPQIISEMREYAQFRGIEIVIGAQTNDIDDEAYLRLFDYIEGGVGLKPDGGIEDGPCFSRWWKKEGDWCWALLWNERFSAKANNVLVHLDWSGRVGDDMSTFALMNRDTRAKTLRNLHSYFVSKDIGFMMPMLAVIPKNNGGCHGAKRKYYSPDNKYSCKDENVINATLKREK